MRMAAQRLGPRNHLAHVLDHRVTFSQVLQRKNPFAVDAGAAGLQATLV